MYVQPFDGPFSSGTLSPLTGSLTGESPSLDGMPPMPPDSIARSAAPWSAESGSAVPFAMFGPLLSMLSQLMQMLQSLVGYQSSGNERFFRGANGSSSGDPHLSFNGNRWSSMASQPDLLDSNSIPGGFQISTQTTPPDGKGVTWNRSATVALQGGATTITLDANGQASLMKNGQSLAVAPGETLQLGDGATVRAERNGSLCITARDASGGAIETTLTARGNGVDVDVNAHDVDLGGALVQGASGIAPQPLWQPQSPFD